MAIIGHDYIGIATIKITRAMEEHKDDVRGKKLRASIKEILLDVSKEAKSNQSDYVKKLKEEVEKFRTIKQLLK